MYAKLGPIHPSFKFLVNQSEGPIIEFRVKGLQIVWNPILKHVNLQIPTGLEIYQRNVSDF